MIDLTYTPQRSDFKATYTINDDVLTVEMDGATEVFDFTGLAEGVAQEIIAEVLPINPVISAEKIGDTVIIKVIQFYGEDEKHLFEDGEVGEN